MLATTGSTIAVIPARVALMCRIEPTIRKNGMIVPTTTIQRNSDHTGRGHAHRDQRPHGQVPLREVPEQRDGPGRDVEREAPPRLRDRPEDRREEEAEDEQR